MHGDHKVAMWGWACITIVILMAISSLTYYNIISPSSQELSYTYKTKKLEFQEKMVKQYNVSPAVLECLDRDWNKVSVYQICKEVLSNNKLTREEAKRLIEKVKGSDK